MNTELFFRYATELAMIIPAGIMSVIPVKFFRKVSTKYLIILFSAIMIISITFGSAVCTTYHLSSNKIIFIFLPLLFLAYHVCYDLSWQKKLFCFMNASMLCSFCTMYSTFATAPLELDNHDDVFKIFSGLICLGITLAIIGAFFRTLYTKLPALLENEGLNKLWSILIFVPLFMTAAMVWMTPLKPENAMVGRLRTVSMVVLWLIPVAVWFLYHILWWIANRMSENAQLQQSHDILKMEEKHYQNTLSYFEEINTLRHDLRHHLLMIEEFAENNEREKLLAYIRPFIQSTERKIRRHFENPVLDAVATHYIELAQEQEIVLLWQIELPEKLPFKESDICALLGNLIENAMKAVAELSKERRKICFSIGYQEGGMLTVHTSNEYRGVILFDKNGLPKTRNGSQGIGLRSVSNIVKKYNGHMVVETEDGKFNVYIIMNPPKEA